MPVRSNTSPNSSSISRRIRSKLANRSRSEFTVQRTRAAFALFASEEDAKAGDEALRAM